MEAIIMGYREYRVYILNPEPTQSHSDYSAWDLHSHHSGASACREYLPGK